ncbi:MAG: hypothetical protein HKN42_18710 [Granulosicoccus sp.]|nr:hypothetical protein [Granulosicoccus sp.]
MKSASTIINTGAASGVHRFCLLGSVLLLVVTAAGCASKAPTVGDSMARERDQYSAISKKWAEGDKLAEKGRKLVKKGQKQVREGNGNIADGEALILRGERMKRDSESEFELKKLPGM